MKQIMKIKFLFFLFVVGLFSENYYIKNVLDERFVLKPSEIKSITFFDNKKVGSNILLYVKGRIIVENKGFGEHCLSLDINGRKLENFINKTEILKDIAFPENNTFFYSFDKKAFFLKYDSDYLPYNSSFLDDPYNCSFYLQNANIKWNRYEFVNYYYTYVFDITNFVKLGKNVINLKNLNSEYSIELECCIKKLSHPIILYTHEPDRLIFPFTFPSIEDLRENLILTGEVTPGTYISLVLTIKNLEEKDLNFDINFENLINESQEKFKIGRDKIEIKILNYVSLKPVWRNLEFIENKEILFPDKLEPSKFINLAEKQAKTIWINVYVPDNISCGKFKGKLNLKSEKYNFDIPVFIDILPFKLSKKEIIWGLWVNNLPGRFDEITYKKIEDLKNHGINSVTMDPWICPVKIVKEGEDIKIDLEGLEKAMELYSRNEINIKGPIPYGVLVSSPLFDQIKNIAQSGIDEENFFKVLEEVLKKIMEISEKYKINLYFHPIDEPDVHPNTIKDFEKICKLIKKIEGAKIWSNLTPSGMKKYINLVDINCSPLYPLLNAYRGLDFQNFFFPEWGIIDKDWIRKNIKNAYIQVRSKTPHLNRLYYGFMAWYLNLDSIWGFAYFWNEKEGWYVAYPILDKDGHIFSTIGWEMLREGIYDYKYLKTLEELLELKFGTEEARSYIIKNILPTFEELSTLSNEDFWNLRKKIINEIVKLLREQK